MTEPLTPLARRIRHERVARDLTQERLAEMVGTSRRRVLAWEQKERPMPRYQAKLQKVLEIPPEVFDRNRVSDAQEDDLRDLRDRLAELEVQAEEGRVAREDLTQLVGELNQRVARLEAGGSSGAQENPA